jgi:hypothetical protein
LKARVDGSVGALDHRGHRIASGFHNRPLGPSGAIIMSADNSRPTNASAKVAYERFVVSVDGQAKSSFPQLADAQKEADRITAGYPKVVVRVLDGERHLMTETPDRVAATDVADSED